MPTLLLLLAASASLATLGVDGPELPRGEIIGAVSATADGTQSYAAYLPTAFRRDRSWPILYVFDPMARGALGVSLFSASAERLGWIVVCSNNSRNGPLAPRRAAVEAVWADTRKRFPIDPRRVYFAGMSGGTGPAWDMGKAFGAGVISSGGPPRTKAAAYLGIRFAFYALAGDGDYNYGPMRNMAQRVIKTGGEARFEVFAGGHGWPPPEITGHAVDWLELLAQRDGLAPKNESFVRALYDETLARARTLEGVNAHHAALLYRSMERDFAGLLPIDEVAASARRLVDSPQAKKARKAEDALLERDVAVQDRLEDLRRSIAANESRNGAPRSPGIAERRIGESSEFDVFGSVDGPDVDDIDPRKTLLDELAGHRKLMAKTERTAEVLLSQRAFERSEQRFIEAAREEIQEGKYAAAVMNLELAVAVRPASPDLRVDLARALVAAKLGKRALTVLREAVSLGYGDLEVLRTDEAFRPIRGERQFLAILDSVSGQRAPLAP